MIHHSLRAFIYVPTKILYAMPHHSQNEEPYFIHGDTYSQERLESMQQWICKDLIFRTLYQLLELSYRKSKNQYIHNS